MKLTLAVLGVGLALLLSSAQAQDVVKVSPGTSKVMLENQHVRVIEATFKPGAKEPVHTHPAGWYYVTKAGRSKSATRAAKSRCGSPRSASRRGWTVKKPIAPRTSARRRCSTFWWK